MPSKPKKRVPEPDNVADKRRWAEEKFGLAVESAPHATVMIDEQGRIVLVNAQTEKLFGYAREDLWGQLVEVLVPDRFRTRHVDYRDKFFTEPAVRSMGVGRDLHGRRKDGSEFPVEIGLTPLDTGEGLLVLGAIVDITARKRAEEKFRLAVESAPNAMVMINPDGMIVLVNSQTETLFGYTRDELLGQAVEMLVPNRFRTKHPEFRAGFFAKPAARSMGVGRDLYGQRKDGSEFPVEIGLNPVQTEDGLFVLSAIVDISERKRAEEKFRLAVESSPSAMVTINADGRMVMVNGQTEKLFGYTRDELLGQPVELLVPERFRDKHPGYRSGFLANPKARSMGVGRDLYGRRKDGSEFPVEIGLNPLETAEGLLVISAIVDISERKRAEEKFRLAVESSPSAMVTINSDGRMVMVNAQTEKLFGYTRDELLGLPVEILVPDRFQAKHPNFRAGFFANPAARSMGVGRDLYGRRKDGSEFPVEIGLNPIETAEGMLVLSAIVDISERKRAEYALRAAHEDLERRVVERTRELEAANKELEAFSYSVSHDLRAPLRAIDGFSRILVKTYATMLPPKAQQYLDDVRRNTLKMGCLVDDLLAFSRLGRQPIKKQTVNVHDLVRQCLNELRGEHAGRQVDIRVGDLPACQADPSLLKQVWINLLANAIKYTNKRESTLIEIGSLACDAPGEQAYFVKDNGVGFDMEYAHKLFGVFQRLHRSEDYEGTGVGLAIVQRILHRHGGRIWVQAESDRGATFYFTLAGKGNSP